MKKEGKSSVPAVGGQKGDLEPKAIFEGSAGAGKKVTNSDDPYKQVSHFGDK